MDVRAEETGENPDIEELFYEVSPQSKSDAIVALLSERQPESCIVFCTTKQQCDELAQELGERGFSALPLHGDLEQRDRDSVLVRIQLVSRFNRADGGGRRKKSRKASLNYLLCLWKSYMRVKRGGRWRLAP